MPIYLIRHAKAGNRRDFSGPDELRPLTRNGWAQAQGLASRLRAEPISRLLSSPFVRCIQTLEPLSAALHIRIEPRRELAEGYEFDAVLPLLESAADHSVLCTHGDVIPAVLDALGRRGLEMIGPNDTRKAATWVLERNGDGRFARVSVVAPPVAGDGD